MTSAFLVPGAMASGLQTVLGKVQPCPGAPRSSTRELDRANADDACLQWQVLALHATGIPGEERTLTSVWRAGPPERLAPWRSIK